jgi:hypothetical protein
MSQNSTDIKTYWKAFEKDPLFFGRMMFPKIFYTGESPSFHHLIADAIANPTEETTVIVCARERAKSTISTFLMPIWLPIFQGYRYICVASLAGDRAKDFLENIKDSVTDPNISNFPKVFGDVRGNKWGAEQIDIVIKNEDLGLDVNCRIRSLGTGMQFAGAIRRDVRPELIIFDDVEDDSTVENDNNIRKMWVRIHDSILPSLDKRRGHFVLIGTPYGHDSVLKRTFYKERRVRRIRIPALVKNNLDEDGYKLSDVLGIPEGKSVWEKQFPTESVIKEMDDWSVNSELESWLAQKMCSFRARSGVYRFHENHIQDFEMSEKNLKEMNFFILGDVGYKQKKYNDPSGIVLVGVDDAKNFYVFEAVEGKWTDVELFEKIVEMARTYTDIGADIQYVGMETVVFNMYERELLEKLLAEGLSIATIELKHQNRKKQDRIRKLIPHSQAGNIHLKTGLSEMKAEMIKYDWEADQEGLHMLDAFAYILDIYFMPDNEQHDGCGSDENKRLWAEQIEAQKEKRTAYWDRQSRRMPMSMRRGLG